MNNFGLFSIGVGGIIGWGAFVLSGNIFLPEHGIINTLIGFMISVFSIVIIERSYSKVAESSNNSLTSINKEVLGNSIGFYGGWCLLLAYISIAALNASSLPVVIDSLAHTSGFININISSISIIISLFFTFSVISLQILNVDVSKVQAFSVGILIFSIVMLSLLCIITFDSSMHDNFMSNLKEINLDSIIRVFMFAPWAFLGFDAISQVKGGTKSTPREISIVTILAIVVGALIYNLVNIITALGVNSNELQMSNWATGDSILRLFGYFSLSLLALSVCAAIFSGLNGFMITSCYLLSNLMEDDSNLVMRKRIVLSVGFIISIMQTLGNKSISWLVDISSVGASVAYAMTALAAIKLSRNFKEHAIHCISLFLSLMFVFLLVTPQSNIWFQTLTVFLIWGMFGKFVKVKIIK